MSRSGIGPRLGLGGLVLGALATQAIVPSSAQAPASEEELIDRVREIQGEPATTSPPPVAGARERELIKPAQAIGRDAQAGASGDARPALGEDEVRTLLGERFGVEILKIEAMQSERGPAYAVTVMNPPGNDNSAFLVETLVVDGATGEVLGQVSQTPRVAPGLAAPSGRVDLDGGLEMRRRTPR
ncbi:MAG: hypothetical protein ACREIR_16725 [Geminicoccaceae bacterium]